MNEITQPTGLKAFGWGVLGFFGSNIIINLVCFVFLALGAEGVFAFFAFVVAVWMAYIWQQSLKYDATKTGVTLSMAIQSIVFIGTFVGALS